MATSKPSTSDAVLRTSAAASSDTVIVKVGAEGKKYNLHTEILKHHSGYFRGALSGAFKETDDGIITLLDVNTDAFDVFVDWLYAGTLPAVKNAQCVNDISLSSRCYVLADRLLAPKLKSAFIDNHFRLNAHEKRITRHSTCKAVVYAFENLPGKDPLLQFMVDAWCTTDNLHNLESEDMAKIPEFPKDFLARVLVKMLEVGQHLPSSTLLKREDYYEST